MDDDDTLPTLPSQDIVATHNARELERLRQLTGPASCNRLHASRTIDDRFANNFKRMFRIDRATSDAILQNISHRLEHRMPNKAHRRWHVLPPKLMLAFALRFLVSGSCLDICSCFEMSLRAPRTPRPRACTAVRRAPFCSPSRTRARLFACFIARSHDRAAPAPTVRSMTSWT